MEEYKISVIMSAYNSEKTIGKAIESVINQTYKNWELIIVNDCSEDKTLDVISKYKDDRIRVISNEVNMGAGVSRGVGIDNITGDYTNFLDSDDYISNDYLETLLRKALTTDSDLVTSGYIEVVGNKDVVHSVQLDAVVENDKKYYPHESLRFLNTCLVKADLWKIVSYSKARFLEDSPVLIKLIWHANRRCITGYTGYHYVQREGSLIHTASKKKQAIYCVLLAIDMYEYFKDIPNSNFPKSLIFEKLLATAPYDGMDVEDLTKEKKKISEWIYNNL